MAIDRRSSRLGVLALVGVILFSLLGVRLWFLQTVKADELQESANVSSTRVVRLAPERGRIFDSEGRVLADNRRVLTLAVDWQMLRRASQREKIFTSLSGWVNVPVAEMEARWDRQIDSPFLPFPIKRGIDEPTAFAILERVEDFPGVTLEYDWERVYPYAPHASHVVGYMGAITREQLDERLDEGYLRNERVGQFGVERSFERALHGEWGYQVIEVDAANRPIGVKEEVAPIDGFDIQLTIDLELQQYVEQAVETTLRARREVSVPNRRLVNPITGEREFEDPDSPEMVPYKAPAGSSIVMDWSNGQVMAMASYPTFDNRWFEANLSSSKFAQIFPSVDEFGEPIDPDESILVNRAIQGRYNLGSTFKPFTAYAALSSGLLSATDTFVDTGTYKLHEESVDRERCAAGLIRCEFKNANCGNGRPCVYGEVNVEEALAVSSDAFFYSIGDNIFRLNEGLPVLQDQVRLFSFGADTGIELPFEFDGTVPDAALKARYAEENIISEGEGRGYYVGDNIQLAIGQGLLSATPLHLATGYATIANGGFVLQPTILKAIWNPGVPDGKPGYADLSQGTVFESGGRPTIVREIDFPDSIRDPIVNGLRRVIYGRGVTSDFYHKTTGEHVFYDYPANAIEIAGKTGTAQGANNYPWNDSSAFAAFSLDAEHPYVVTSYLEKSGYGSQASAPLVKCVFLVLSDITQPEPVERSELLDINATEAAPRQEQRDTTCWNGKQGNSVRTQEPAVE